MATKQEPIRRNDVIRCEKCGEDYSVTYKRCPFCDERPARTRRVNGGTSSNKSSGRRVSGSSSAPKQRNVNPLQVAGIVGSLVLIIAALYIVFSAISPLLGLGKDDEPGSHSSTSTPSYSQSTPAPGVSQPSTSTPGTTTPSDPEVVEPIVVHVNSLKLSKSDFTLSRNETWQIKATVDPADTPVIWTSSDESVAKVAQDGTVYNVNTSSSKKNVIITATAGDKTAECIVRCNGGSSGLNFPADYAPGTVPAVPSDTTPTTPSTPTTPTTPTTPSTPSTPSSGSATTMNARGTITGASSGLNVRSGPGSSYDAIASLNNGASVTILQDTGAGWYKISFSGIGGRTTEGYVSKDYVSVR